MPSFEDLPRPSFWKRFLLGAVLVVFATAAATAVTAFREVDKVVSALKENESIPGVARDIAKSAPGKAQTILLLGSDKRPDDATDGGAGGGQRSDTIILVRLDPEENATALMSLPRDLKVEIPGYGVDKINAAYSIGGPSLTLKTIKRLTGLSINHVVNVDFKGFQKAIDALGCIYTDVDRRYYNDTAAFAYINIPAGYQRMCGEKALQYARFRHEDSDLVRGIRQQDLLKDAKHQIGAGQLFDDRERLIEIFAKHTTSDSELKSPGELIRLLKLAVYSVGQPIQHVPFEGEVGITSDPGGPSYVTASDATVKALAQKFLGVEEGKGPRGELKPKGKRKGRNEPAGDDGLERETQFGKDQAVQAIEQGAGGGKFPVYYPTVRLRGSEYIGPPRVYKIATTDDKRRKSYRMVLKYGLINEYYGLQGTRWLDPPILDGEFDERKIGKRTFELHYDGDRLRLVAWRTPNAVYWVSNTLLQTLSARQMLSIARSTRLP